MVQIRNFSESLERDLSRLHSEVEGQRAVHEAAGVQEREIVKRSVEAYAEKVAPTASTQSVPATAPASAAPSPLPDYLMKEGAEGAKKEVERLVALVFAEDISTAVKEARKQPPFIQDAFHDALTDKLMPELKRRGIVS